MFAFSQTMYSLKLYLSFKGKRVGLLDADIFGPTIPLMMNLNDKPLIDEKNLLIPLQNYGVKWYVTSGPINPNN